MVRANRTICPCCGMSVLESDAYMLCGYNQKRCIVCIKNMYRALMEKTLMTLKDIMRLKVCHRIITDREKAHVE